jgi:hypothetical protein
MITVAGISLGAVTPASAAGSTQDYRDVMKDFVPTIAEWGTQTETALDAAVAKPELACGAEMAELTRSGLGIAADLLGTADKAPTSLLTVHYDLTDAVAGMAQISAQSCADSAAAVSSFEMEKTRFDTALAEIKMLTESPFIVGPRGPGITPGKPGPGN